MSFQRVCDSALEAMSRNRTDFMAVPEQGAFHWRLHPRHGLGRGEQLANPMVFEFGNMPQQLGTGIQSARREPAQLSIGQMINDAQHCGVRL